jgi:hypothetical protein
MFGRLIQAYRWAKAAERSVSFRPRCRPAVEQLESRLAPSMTPLPAVTDGPIAEPAHFMPIHIANPLPAAAATPASTQDQALVAIVKAVQAKTERDAGFVAAVAAPPSDTPLVRPIVAEPAAAELPLETTSIGLSIEPAEAPALDLPVDVAGFDRANVLEPVRALQDVEPEITPQRSEAPAISAHAHVEYFALNVVEAERAAADTAPSCEESAPAEQTVTAEAAPAHASMPLLTWLIGMACLLALHWERRLAGPGLSRAAAAWARWRKSLAEWSAFAGQVTFAFSWQRARS